MINKKIDIWESLNYAGSMEDAFRPILTTYIRGGGKKRGMVLVCPGGGYAGTSPREAEPIAMVFNNAGYHSAVLDYSVAPRRHPQPLKDVARALTIIRERTVAWDIDLSCLFIIGFSAGGHLAASFSNLYKEPWLSAYEGVDLMGLSLKGCILSYPVLTAGEFRHVGSFDNLLGPAHTEEERMNFSMELLVNPHTPKTFLWHTVADGSVPVENSLLYAQALRKHKIPFEMHIYPDGGHGLSLCNHETAEEEGHIQPHAAGWMEQCLGWMSTV